MTKERFKGLIAPDAPPALGVMCCYHCRFARRVTDNPLGSKPFVTCHWGPPSVVIEPAGLNQITGQAQLAIKSRFPAMGYTEFCHRFETVIPFEGA